MVEDNDLKNKRTEPDNEQNPVPVSPQQAPPVVQSEQQISNFKIIIGNSILILSCISLIGGMFIVSMVLATIFGPHSSCDKWGCSPAKEALVIYGIGSFLISVPISIKILKSGFRKK